MACVALSRPTAESFEHRLIGEDDSVDRLIASCKPKVRPTLPSAGRDLVPYFASGAQDFPSQTLSEMATQHRKKASKNKTPPLGASGSDKHVRGVASAPQTKHGKRVVSTKIKDQHKAVAATTMVTTPKAPIVPVVPRSASVSKAWAGPSFYNSPAPECLPLPTAHLLAV